MKKKMFYLELKNMIVVGMLGKSYQILNRYQIEDHKVDPKKKIFIKSVRLNIKSLT